MYSIPIVIFRKKSSYLINLSEPKSSVVSIWDGTYFCYHPDTCVCKKNLTYIRQVRPWHLSTYASNKCSLRVLLSRLSSDHPSSNFIRQWLVLPVTFTFVSYFCCFCTHFCWRKLLGGCHWRGKRERARKYSRKKTSVFISFLSTLLSRYFKTVTTYRTLFCNSNLRKLV